MSNTARIDAQGIHFLVPTTVHFAHSHTATHFSVTTNDAGLISREQLSDLTGGLWTVSSDTEVMQITTQAQSPLLLRKGHHDFTVTSTKDGLLKVAAALDVRIAAQQLTPSRVALTFTITGLPRSGGHVTALSQHGLSGLPSAFTWTAANSSAAKSFSATATCDNVTMQTMLTDVLNQIFDLTVATADQTFTVATTITGNRYRPLGNRIAWLVRSRKVPRYPHLAYRVMSTVLPIRNNTYFFQSYLARSMSCSPRAMYDYLVATEPSARFVWSLNDINVPTRARTTTVRPGSLAHYYYLATAKFIVSNTGLADGFEKRRGQIHLQTWHGSTLKRIGRDKGIADSERQIRGGAKDSKTLTGFARRVSMWDFLLVANSLSAEAHLTAWRFDSEMLHTGYPRNDALFDAEWVQQQRQRVRSKYAIPDDHVVALWAPTWRDDAPTVNGRLVYQLPLSLIDVAHTSKLTILAKMHYKVGNLIDDSGLQPTFINVSEWNDVNDLFPASDVLISDFSGTIPDYANTGKPIVFYIPDYDDYMESRGTYFDIPTEGPGPLVRTESELFATLQDLSWTDQYASRYAYFREVYGEYDDGHAAERAVKRMLNPAPARRNGITRIS